MAQDTILQHWIFTEFALPFLLIFFIVFAILEKTELLGDDKKQINALVAFVIGLIFVSAVSPKLMVSNLILFLTVAIVVMFIGMLLWGFVAGGDVQIKNDKVKWAMGIAIVIGVIGAVIWATGFYSFLDGLFFGGKVSGDFWINAVFVVVIAIALAVAIGSKGKSS